MKKIIALLLASLLCAASLVSCENTDNDLNNNPAGTETGTPENSEAPSDDGTENTVTNKEEPAVGISAYNWKYNDDDVMFTVNEIPVTFEQYRYYAMNSKVYYDNGDASYWNDETDQEHKEDIISEFKLLISSKLLANELGMELTDNDIAQIKFGFDQVKAYYGEEEFKKQLDSLYLDEELSNALSEYDYMREKLLRHYVTTEDIMNYANENYVHVQHVLVSTLDEEGNELTGEAFDEKTALANEIYQKATSGEDFYSLVEQYGEDPGMEGNPDGYTFTYNMMVKEFEEASFALEVGGISEPVKTSYGYHIIKKLDLEEDYFLDENGNDFWNILYTLGSEPASNAINEYANNLEVKTTEEFDTLNMRNIAENK